MKMLWFGNSHYGAVLKVGCNYYTELLADMGHKVLFVSPPISILHRAKRYHDKIQLAKKGLHKVKENLFVYIPYTLLQPAKKIPFKTIHKHWHKLTIPNIYKVIKSHNFDKVDIVFIDYFAYGNIVNLIKYKKLVVRITDNIKGFKTSNIVTKIEKELTQKADLAIVSAYNLLEKTKQYNKNVIVVPNGVDISKYKKDYPKPAIFDNLKSIVVYVGVIDFWFDYRLLEYCAKSIPDTHFFIIGPVHYKNNEYEKVYNLSNVHFTGSIPTKDVPIYLKHANVGIIPFNTKFDLVHSISPLKLYEYMAAGLPVVSTRWKELENIKSPAILCDSKECFKDSIIKSLSRTNTEKEISFARQNTWESKIKEILNAI